MSYGVYAQHNIAYTLILLSVTIVTFVFAIWIEKVNDKHRRKLLAVSGGLMALLPLLVFKYYNFITSSGNALLRSIHFDTSLPGLNWAIPLGISFFTLQAIGYLLDVYHGRIQAERSWWSYMLFVSFFPQVMSGPISKAKDLLPQIKAYRQFDATQATQGLRWFVWGLFLKVMLADRLGLYVDKVLDNYTYHSGTSCLLACILYSLQIYGDFAGYSYMAMGVGKLMGFNLINNFQRPYLSTSITDFWHRWHISLSTWLKDHVYIPLGGSHCSKLKNYWNILVTFLVSGIWHGANWTFIFWGCLHGLYQIVEKMTGCQKCTTHHWWIRLGHIALTFALVTVAWIFFRQPTIGDAFAVIGRIATEHSAIFMASRSDIVFSAMAILILMTVDVTREFCPRIFKSFVTDAPVAVRWMAYYVIMLFILLCGVFDSSQFIYVSF